MTHFSPIEIMPPDRPEDEIQGARERLVGCLAYLDLIGMNDIASHVSLAVDRFNALYPLPHDPIESDVHSGASEFGQDYARDA